MSVEAATPERSPWRWPAAAIAVTIVAAHLPITPAHLNEAPYIGLSFVALEIALTVLAVALMAGGDTRSVWRATLLLPALAILAYLVTRAAALPEIADDQGNWTEPLSFVALAAEALLVVVAAAHSRTSWTRSRLVAHPMLLGGLLLAVGLALTGWAAVTSAA
ncbi:MAG TPA: hypothetical protein VHO26_10930 [Propionibacteriaceae bacterium]|nr:hypothetical protein [Propionibacteriaceae bacterium]